MSQQLESTDSIDSITANLKPAPGTEILYDQDGEHGKVSGRLRQLQHVRKGDSHILLVPQPSLEDPNDPLSWPSWKKWATFANGLGYSFLGAVTGPIMAACKHSVNITWRSCFADLLAFSGMVQGSAFFGKSLQEMSHANGATLVCQGAATTLWMWVLTFGCTSDPSY